MQANRGRDTAPEMAVRRVLHSRGLRYRVDVAPLPGLRCRADVVFPSVKIAVFVDGCFWHGCPDHMTWPQANRGWWLKKIAATKRRDLRNSNMLTSEGWTVIRTWEHEDPHSVADRIEAVVRSGMAARNDG